jgi:Na+/alanine symporter
MDPNASGLANPWVPYVFLGTALVVTVATLGVQARAIVLGVRSWWSDARAPADATVLLGGSAGLAGIVGSAVAVTVAGPGALVWMWIATALGMSLHFIEARSTAEGEDEAPFVSRRLGSLGKMFAAWSCLAFLPLAVLAGGMLQSQQAAAAIGPTVGASLPVLTAMIGIAAVPFGFSSRLRDPLIRIGVPVAILLYCAFGIGILSEDSLLLELALGDAWRQAFGIVPAAGGTAAGAVTVAAHHGILRAITGGQLALGPAGWSTSPGAKDPRAIGAAAMLVPLVTVGALGTTTALAIAATPVERVSVIEGNLVPLERAFSRGLRPSQQVGQTVVLPDDAGLEAGKFYAMVMRSNPRGHPFAQLLRDDNAVFLAQWEISEDVTQVVFRAKEPRLAARAAWDVRVDCDVEVIEAGGIGGLRLTPKDPDLDFAKLISHFELDSKPHVPVSDFRFVGRVAKATSPDERIGEHLALYEPPSDDRPFNPKFHEFFRGGYRGPYPQTEDPRPPWGFVATEGFDAEIGSVVKLELVPDPRGEDLLRVNRAGGLEGPPWDLMMQVREVVLRHREGPTQDIVVPVRASLDGFRVRLAAEDPQWEDFRKVERIPDLTGPFARIGAVRFEAEVHSDMRLAPELAGRRSLVPIHEQGEPAGPTGAIPYTPHPAELVEAGVAGPFVVREGVEALTSRFEHRYGAVGSTVFAVVAFVLGLAAIAVQSGFAARCAAFLFGDRARGPARALVLGGALVGGSLAFDLLLAWIDVAIALVLLPNAVGLIFARFGEPKRGPSAGPSAGSSASTGES